jgi:hypothetical protein
LLSFPDRRDLPFYLSCPLTESHPLAWPIETLSGDFRPGEMFFLSGASLARKKKKAKTLSLSHIRKKKKKPLALQLSIFFFL